MRQIGGTVKQQPGTRVEMSVAVSVVQPKVTEQATQP